MSSTVVRYASPNYRPVVFGYDKNEVHGETIKIRAENLFSEDVGERVAVNTGTFVLFYPVGAEVTDHIIVTGSDGGTTDGYVNIRV